jgi:ankyrin repeat protein
MPKRRCDCAHPQSVGSLTRFANVLQNGETALTWACTTGYAPSVEALLKAGANLSVAREVRSPRVRRTLRLTVYVRVLP